MAVKYQCEAGRINSVLWNLSLVPIVFILVYTPLVQANVDDDTTLQFYWDPPITGDVSYYNVYLFVYDGPDASGPGSEDDYVLVDDTFDTHGSASPTLTELYKLCDTLYASRGAAEPIAIGDRKGYQIKVAAVDSIGTIGPKSEPPEIVWCDLNDPPVANSQSVTTNENTPVGITLTGSDPDGDPLTYAVVSNPSNGSLSGTAPGLTYTPNAGFSGSDSLTFKVNDGTVDSNMATVNITVRPFENVTAVVEVRKLGYSYNYLTHELALMATWTNTGSITLIKPLRMVIENTSPSSITPANPDGSTLDGKPYYDYSDLVGDDKLDPGEISEAKELIFTGAKGILEYLKLKYEISCWACVDSNPEAESTASMSITVDPIVESDSSFFVSPGWHLISIPVEPIDAHPSAVLSSIDGKYSSVWAYNPDTGWSVYAPGSSGGLQSMEPGRGYWIKMEQGGILDVEGNNPEETAISLKGGKWNLVGYSSQDPRYAEECMEHIAYAINSVWGYDPETGWSLYAPGSPSDLIVMLSWHGYWIKVEQTCTWDVNNASTLPAPSAAVK